MTGLLQEMRLALGAADPTLKDDLLKVLGLTSTWKEIEGDREEADVDLVRTLTDRLKGLEARAGGLESQIRELGQLYRASKKLTELALTTAAQADSQAASNAQGVARLRWVLEEFVAQAVQARAADLHGEEGAPPTREHVRRALGDAVEATAGTTTQSEDDLITAAFLGSLTPKGTKDGIGARLRKLITSGKVGPPEIALLRQLVRSGRSVTKIELSRAEDLSELFALASASPSLVTVEVDRAGQPPDVAGGFLSSLDQLRSQAQNLLVRVTDRGRDLLTMLEESKTMQS